jgi:hypothetical protein
MKTLVLGLVLLAANIVAAHAEDRKCIDANRLCDEKKNYVTNPNEYGWVRNAPECTPKRVKGEGAKQQKDAPCE